MRATRLNLHLRCPRNCSFSRFFRIVLSGKMSVDLSLHTQGLYNSQLLLTWFTAVYIVVGTLQNGHDQFARVGRVHETDEQVRICAVRREPVDVVTLWLLKQWYTYVFAVCDPDLSSVARRALYLHINYLGKHFGYFDDTYIPTWENWKGLGISHLATHPRTLT